MFNLEQECIVCDQEYQHLLPQDYHSKNRWHHFFDCCTNQCLEYHYGYSEFKKEFMHLTDYFDLFWKKWVISKALEKDEKRLSPQELLNMHIGVSYSLILKENLFHAGLSVENAEDIAWSKNIEYPKVQPYIYYQ